MAPVRLPRRGLDGASRGADSITFSWALWTNIEVAVGEGTRGGGAARRTAQPARRRGGRPSLLSRAAYHEGQLHLLRGSAEDLAIGLELFRKGVELARLVDDQFIGHHNYFGLVQATMSLDDPSWD